MKVIYAKQEIPSSIFLVGPTPRNSEVESWRPQALKILEKLNYTGTVFVPESMDGEYDYDYINQVEWELKGLQSCSCVAAWVPRDLKDMPAFTTNVEFGSYVRSGKFLYGRPESSPKNSYLDWLYKKTTGREPFSHLGNLLLEAMKI